ncbi:MAG: hypothetical protein J3Q66DRAFT_85573 [Benniella sp.]|nr:MAG: hypothetical protein J3Q66DRAFT_85573 [Benniella sp.]
MYMTIVQEEQGNQINIDFRVKACARERIELEFLARLLFLQFLLDRNPDLKPQQFFREQTNGGASAIGTLVFKLQEYKNITIQAMLRKIETKLRSLLAPRELGLVIAVDEAQIAENGILAGRLISPSALANSREALFGSKNEIQPQFRRGFLTPLSATLSSIQATLVVLGTALTLQNADHVCSAIAKETNFIRITEFPHFNEEDVDKLISNLVDTSDCVIPPAKRRKLSGRARFPIGIVYRLANTGSRQDNKQAILDEAVTNTIDDVMAGLKEGVRTALISDKTGQSAHLLSRMVLAYRLHGSKISFSSQKEFDFVDRGLCRLQLHSDEIHYIMDEPLALEAVEEVLKASGEDPELKEYLDQLYQIVDNLGVASTSKGNALEPLVRRSLKRFNGFRLADLPFLQGITLPEWCNKLEVRIDEIHTANGFGYTDDMAGDLAFLTERPANKMLVAGFGTRPDGAWFFSDNHYAGTLAIKFFSGPIPQRHHKANETSSDLRCCFLQKDGLKINKSLQNIRQHFEKSDTYSKLKGILRIHVEIPSVASVEPVTYVKRHPTTGMEDEIHIPSCWIASIV